MLALSLSKGPCPPPVRATLKGRPQGGLEGPRRWLLAFICALALLPGCKSPSPEQFLPPLRQQVEQDDQEYNSRMSQYGAPQMAQDGSVYTMMRYERTVAIPWDQIKVEKTGGRTTPYRAVVPKITQPYVKSGPTADSCAAAPERPLDPQKQNVLYEYNSVQKQWSESLNVLQ